MRRSRAPSNWPGPFFAARSWAGCTTNMFGFDLRQAQPDLKTAEALGIDIPRDATRARRLLFVGRLTGATSRCVLSIHRQGELKRSTVGHTCRGPQPATVGFHDRTADRKPHTHAAGFGGEEGVEQPIRILGGDPDT